MAGCFDDSVASLSARLTAPALPGEIASLEITVLDAAATCGPPDVKGGVALARTTVDVGGTARISVTPGERVISVVAYDADSVSLARGCDAVELEAGEHRDVRIALEPWSGGGGDAGPDGGPGGGDAGPTLDAAPGGDSCDEAGDLPEGATATGITGGAGDDLPIGCQPSDSADTVHRFQIAAPSAVLVTVTPLDPAWSAAASLRSADACEEADDLACAAGAPRARHLTRPYLDPGWYAIVIDGAAGATGGYEVSWQSRAGDATFGYWRLDRTAPYQTLSGGTTVPGFAPGGDTDEASWTVALPFTFDFHGTPYASVEVSSNGFLTFDAVPTGGASYANDCPLNTTTPQNTIALFWDDTWAPSSAPAAQLLTQTDGSAPNRRFSIEYRNWDFVYCPDTDCLGQGARLTQKVVLHESGDIELHYGPRTAPTVDTDCGLARHLGCSATIGLENGSGTDVDMAQCNAATVEPGKLFYFVHPGE